MTQVKGIKEDRAPIRQHIKPWGHNEQHKEYSKKYDGKFAWGQMVTGLVVWIISYCMQMSDSCIVYLKLT